MATETEVTIAVTRFLNASNFRILALALPGSGSGVLFRSEDPHFPPIVPDIIAKSPQNKVVVVESKPFCDNSDVKKLKALVSGNYDNSISKMLEIASTELITAIAFPQVELDSVPYGEVDIIFTVDETQTVRILSNSGKITLG